MNASTDETIDETMHSRDKIDSKRERMGVMPVRIDMMRAAPNATAIGMPPMKTAAMHVMTIGINVQKTVAHIAKNSRVAISNKGHHFLI